MFYLGIDQHAKQSTVNLRDSKAGVLLRRQVSTQPDKVLEFFEQITKRCAEHDCGFTVNSPFSIGASHSGHGLVSGITGFGAIPVDTTVTITEPKRKSMLQSARKSPVSYASFCYVPR